MDRSAVVRRSARTASAIGAQFSQAFAAFVLSALAARALGASGLGLYALLTGWIVLVTGVMTGMVGDSLTVLDRSKPRIRAGLQWWCLVIGAATTVLAAGICAACGVVTVWTAVTFGLAAGSWVLEDTARRLLMANMRFWGVVVVDLTHLTTALTVLAVVHGVRPLTLSDFMLALMAGQLVGIITAVVLVPEHERWVVRHARGAIREVAAFGVWRGTQQAIRPGTLSVMRVLVIVAVGTASFGHLEAARIYMSPALLTVQGVGSFLLAHYAAGRHEPVARSIRRADMAALVLVVSSVAIGGLAVAFVGWLGPVVTGSSFKIDPLAVAAWAVFAASVAAVMPYTSLAAVRGRQAIVVFYRVADAAVSVVAVVVALFLTGISVSWVPMALALGSLAGAYFQRRVARGLTDPVTGATAPLPSVAATVDVTGADVPDPIEPSRPTRSDRR